VNKKWLACPMGAGWLKAAKKEKTQRQRTLCKHRVLRS
jgi:hypothetical protein